MKNNNCAIFNRQLFFFARTTQHEHNNNYDCVLYSDTHIFEKQQTNLVTAIIELITKMLWVKYSIFDS